MKARTIPFLLLAAVALVAPASPALAWWQFVALGPNGERQVYTRYKTEKECNAALKIVQTRLEKKYPIRERFPLVGSCEEYH
jgi:hypothetical protein